MNITFIKTDESSHLILIMAGWGMTDAPFRNLTAPGYDIAVGWDYRSEEVDTSLFKRYREVVLIAWSMGVMEAVRIVPALGLPLTLAIAVNGTPTPVSDTDGIPQKIFDGTLSTLSESNVARFNRRMCGSTEHYKQFNISAPNRSIESLRDELRILANVPWKQEKHLRGM